jgi:hypothetical protein
MHIQYTYMLLIITHIYIYVYTYVFIMGVYNAKQIKLKALELRLENITCTILKNQQIMTTVIITMVV